MRTFLALAAITCTSALAHPHQVVIAPSARDSLTPSLGFQSNGYGALRVGFDSNSDLAWEGLVLFDVASAIPAGARVNSVELVCVEGWENALADTPVELRACTTAWTAGAETWTSPWTTPGGDFGPVVAEAHPYLAGPTVFATNTAFVALVQAWLDAPAANFGCFLRDPTFFIQEALYLGETLVVDFDPPCASPVSYCVAAPNSLGAGAFISSLGSTRISDANFALVVTGARPGATGWYFAGSLQQQVPFGDGFLCAGGALLRFPAMFADANGAFVRPLDFASGAAVHIAPGATWNFQLKYRNAVPGGAGYNFSDALAVTFCP